MSRPPQPLFVQRSHLQQSVPVGLLNSRPRLHPLHPSVQPKTDADRQVISDPKPPKLNLTNTLLLAPRKLDTKIM